MNEGIYKEAADSCVEQLPGVGRLKCLFSNLRGCGASVQGRLRLRQWHGRNANAVRLTSVLLSSLKHTRAMLH